MFYVKLSESTAARKRVPIYLVDAANGYTPETGVTSPTIEVSKNGAAQASGTGTFTEIGDGAYYYEFASGEIDTLGWVNLRVVKSGTSREYQTIVHITAFDAYDAVRLGLTALPNANAEAAGGLYTRGAGAGQINQSSNGQVDVNAVAVSGDSTAADNAEAFFDGTGYAGGTIPLAVNTTQFAGQTITCAGGVTIPAATLASTTNITGGTLTTVTTATNLTNAPTNGDLTATMKTSIQTELSTYGALRPTVAGRTLDVTATGAAGIDWANVENPTTTLNLSGTTVTTVVSVTNVGADVWSYSSRTLTGPARQISSRQVGTLTLTKGDSYLNADGNALTFTKATNATWPTDLTSWTPKLSIEPSADLLAVASAAASISDITGTVVTATGDSRAVRFDLTAAQTATLTATTKALYNYDVQVSSSNSRATLETGVAYVIDEQTTG